MVHPFAVNVFAASLGAVLDLTIAQGTMSVLPAAPAGDHPLGSGCLRDRLERLGPGIRMAVACRLQSGATARRAVVKPHRPSNRGPGVHGTPSVRRVPRSRRGLRFPVAAPASSSLSPRNGEPSIAHRRPSDYRVKSPSRTRRPRHRHPDQFSRSQARPAATSPSRRRWRIRLSLPLSAQRRRSWVRPSGLKDPVMSGTTLVRTTTAQVPGSPLPRPRCPGSVAVNPGASTASRAADVSDGAAFAQRRDIRHLPDALKDRLTAQAKRPTTLSPMTVLSEAPSRPLPGS